MSFKFVEEFHGSFIIKCPCGCGDEIKVNLDKRAGPAWGIYRKNGITLYPSVWRDSGCKSHFILWDDEIYWCTKERWWNYKDIVYMERGILSVLQRLKKAHYEHMSEILEEIPWNVLLSCRALVKK